MELDQILFKKIFTFFGRRNGKATQEELDRTVHLDKFSGRLTLIARALTGRSIDIATAEKEGGWKNEAFYLPASFGQLSTFEKNLNYYIFRVVYLCVQQEKNLNWTNVGVQQTVEESRIMAREVSPVILKTIDSDYPSVFEYYQSIESFFSEDQFPAYWLYGKYMTNQDVYQSGQESEFDKQAHGKETVNPTTEIKSKPVEEAEILTVDKKAQEDYVMTHNFEKVETAEEFTGIWRGFDGDDSLEEDSDALNELDLKHLVRSDEVAKSIYQADFRDLANIAESKKTESDEVCLTYKEWDFAKGRYKPDFCKVFYRKPQGVDLSYAKKCIAENAKNLNGLRRKFAQIHQQRQTVRRLQDGETIDIDTLVEWYSDLHSGKTPSDKIYLSKRKKEPELAILFLLDSSLSTDSYADGNRVLDVEKQAVTLFGEVLEEYQVDFAVSSFYSKTRNNCVYNSIKEFEEPWSKGKHRLGAIEPEGYTRIGPALRHAQSLIEHHSAKQKWVILLSDGKPNDYDQYEGKYGVADVKQALREMHSRHISTYAIAVESIARYYLPQMFGQNHYNILSHPDMLIPSLTILYKRISNCN